MSASTHPRPRTWSPCSSHAPRRHQARDASRRHPSCRRRRPRTARRQHRDGAERVFHDHLITPYPIRACRITLLKILCRFFGAPTVLRRRAGLPLLQSRTVRRFASCRFHRFATVFAAPGLTGATASGEPRRKCCNFRPCRHLADGSSRARASSARSGGGRGGGGRRLRARAARVAQAGVGAGSRGGAAATRS